MGLSVASINKQIETAPLSRKEAKEQFINKTKEFNLQHAFNFDEAWAFVEYKTKQKDFRKTIASFEETLKNHENSLGTETHTLNPTKHSFADGQYIREIYNPAGLVLITKIHAKTHPFFLMQGEMTIVTETECVFITVHRTDKLTVEEIEQDVIATSFDKEHLTVPDTKHIRRLIKEMNKCLG